MTLLDTLKEHSGRIRAMVESHRACNPRVFGSVLHGEETDASDIDILVEPLPTMSLFDLGAIQYELSELLGKRVDVLTPEALPDKFRQQVMQEAAAL
ncbi:nucleotidyltransferase family protein [Thiothrix nivea]|uniref:DNA polymerase beta domain protein region n=1 Tax=Thiothrix nivea (strain ATCC 35100 / DSM 5205 / JP2) TaxID=870187 RepID=A0A656HLL0_THINJ|nr:nucleotidyltransferase family protein [Thiothrix nivea]EIJ36179.1 DNA polymerase beta domain protein region [Thiothrix nivea DSM 5205]